MWKQKMVETEYSEGWRKRRTRKQEKVEVEDSGRWWKWRMWKQKMVETEDSGGWRKRRTRKQKKVEVEDSGRSLKWKRKQKQKC